MPTNFNYTRSILILGMLLVAAIALAFGAGVEYARAGFTDMTMYDLSIAVVMTIAFGWAAVWVMGAFFDRIREEKSQ